MVGGPLGGVAASPRQEQADRTGTRSFSVGSTDGAAAGSTARPEAGGGQQWQLRATVTGQHPQAAWGLPDPEADAEADDSAADRPADAPAHTTRSGTAAVNACSAISSRAVVALAVIGGTVSDLLHGTSEA
jgi:hypothetical protein